MYQTPQPNVPSVNYRAPVKPIILNEPTLRLAGKIYTPDHPMYPVVRGIILERYKKK